MIGDQFLKLLFSGPPEFPPGVPGLLVIGLVAVGRKIEHERVPKIVLISFQATQCKLKPSIKTIVVLVLP